MKKVVVLIIAVLFFSCSEYEKVLKGSDYDKKYELGVKLYEKKKYVKALPLLEEVISIYSKLSERGERAYYYMSYCHYNAGDYNMASYYFKNYTRTYPNSDHVEECAFMSAYCKVNSSASTSLDQSETFKAIDELQLFMNRYPNSSQKDTCNIIIDGLRAKLEKKAFENAYLYYKTEDYKAASIAFQNMLDDYPDTDYREELLFYDVKAKYSLAINSVDDKKKERFEETTKSYIKFADNYPTSKKRRELESIYQSSLSEIEKFKYK